MGPHGLNLGPWVLGVGLGRRTLTEKEQVFVLLQNNGSFLVFGTIFNINADGRGIEVHLKRPAYTFGEDQFGLDLVGLPVACHHAVPATQPVPEHLFFVTHSLVELKHKTETNGSMFRGDASTSSLEQLAFRLAAEQRKIERL
jgi:hypothetical protein